MKMISHRDGCSGICVSSGTLRLFESAAMGRIPKAGGVVCFGCTP